MSDDKRESYDAYMSRMMREQSEKSNNHITSVRRRYQRRYSVDRSIL